MFLRFVVFFVFCVISVDGQIIGTFVGTGIAGCNGYPGIIPSPEVNDPNGMAVDRMGNIYFANEGCNTVCKIDLLGNTSIVAGGGIASDGNPASNAMLNLPNAITFDKLGNLYIVDRSSLIIRKVDAITGIISTYAGNGTIGFAGDGGHATAAEFGASGICFDNKGNLYISDGENNRIRKIDSVGIITTIGGTGIAGFSGDGGPASSAKLWDPFDVKLDKYGNIYFPDMYNHRIRKIDTNGIITTIAGTGIGLYNGNDILATSANIAAYKIGIDKFGNIYMSDSNARIRQIDKKGYIHTMVGTGVLGFNGDGIIATTAQISIPTGIVFDSCNNMYFGENGLTGSQRIRKITFPKCDYLQVSEIEKNNEVPIYPNPTCDELNLNNLKAPATYRLLNMVGTTMQQGTLKVGNNTLSLQSLPDGMYLLEIIDDQKNRTVYKIVKQ